ncbi:MAG: hypothetical protein NTU99_12355 [Pseudanabaena sp. LacPavin_0818_WC45_MAG_42_6]|nr:hypothetical protein [Pseudanabaena sp. LacPavin_0818_WC45_MAG_42_6]
MKSRISQNSINKLNTPHCNDPSRSLEAFSDRLGLSNYKQLQSR